MPPRRGARLPQGRGGGDGRRGEVVVAAGREEEGRGV